jgi:cytochrome P450
MYMLSVSTILGCYNNVWAVLLPQGTKLWVNLRMVLDDPQWVEGAGPLDPRTFNPSRWLTDDSAARIGWLAFGAGPRMCLGYPFATTELKVRTAQSVTVVRASAPTLSGHVQAPA